MPLIDLKTNLKDLKFGHDEYKGASSNEPYIQTKIPATDEPLQTGISNAGPALVGLGAGAAIGAVGGSILGSTGTGAAIGAAVGLGIGIIGANTTTSGFRLPSAGTGGPDFLVRGGTLLPNILVNDEIRLTKYFASTEGILFTVKQNLLSRMGTRAQGTTGLLNERLYTPISTLLGAVGTPFGLHVNKQGLNPLLGVGDPFTPDRYFAAISTDILNSSNQNSPYENSKLSSLYGIKISKDFDNVSPFLYEKFNISKNSEEILNYQGGPGSFLGIGKTHITLATDNTGAPLSTANIPNYKGGAVGYNTLNYSGIDEISKSDSIGDYRYPIVVDFRTKLKKINTTNTLISNSPSYNSNENKTLEIRTSLGDPGYNFEKNLSSYTDGDSSVGIYSYKGVSQPGGGKGAASPNSPDKINASCVDTSHAPTDPPFYKDLVDFRIGVINNNAPGGNRSQIYFRAFLDNISDNYTSNWDATKYIGRGENFYTYSGFDRKVSLSWTVAAQSKIELMQMYRKLNYLASVCAPNYSEEGYMRGNLIELTIGGYFYQQPGIITGLSFEMNEENDSWEIAINDAGDEDTSVKQLPHIIRVKTFNFTPIHKFVPSLQSINVNEEGIFEYGNQRYIALENSRGTNWNMSKYPT